MQLLFCTISFLLCYATAAATTAAILFESDIPHPLDGIHVTIDIQGRDYLFLVDSGSTYVVLDKRFARLLGEPYSLREINTPFEKQWAAYYKPIDIWLGDLNLNTENPFMLSDLELLRRSSGLEIYGIIGMAFMHRYAWWLDFENRKLKVMESADIGTMEHAALARIHWGSDSLPRVNAEIGEHRWRFLLDTGQQGTGSVADENYQTLLQSSRLTPLQNTLSVVINGVRESEQGRLQGLTLAGCEYPPLIINNAAHQRLGLALLRRHQQVLLDFPDRRLFLSKLATPAQPDRLDKSRMNFVRINGEIIIFSVEPNSPAARAGIKRWAILTRVNGQDTNDLSLGEVRHLFKQPVGAKIALQLWQHGRTQQVSLKLE